MEKYPCLQLEILFFKTVHRNNAYFLERRDKGPIY